MESVGLLKKYLSFPLPCPELVGGNVHPYNMVEAVSNGVTNLLIPICPGNMPGQGHFPLISDHYISQ